MIDLTNNNMSFNEFKEAIQTNEDSLNNKIEQIWTESPTNTVYTVIVDMEESDPNNAVSYANAASLYSAGSEEWFNNELFKDIRPCLLNDGQVMCYLDPNNYNQQIKPVDNAGAPTYEPIFLRDDIIKAPSENLYICQIENAQDSSLSSVNLYCPSVTQDPLVYFAEDKTWRFVSGYENYAPVYEIVPKMGWVAQKGVGVDRGYDTTVCFKPEYKEPEDYIECKFNNIEPEKEYYLEMRFYAKEKGSTGIPQTNIKRMIDIECEGMGRKTFNLPKKGRELKGGEPANYCQYEFQIMRIYLGVLKENSYTINLYRTLEVYTDGTIGDPEIDYIALRSVDPIVSEPANVSYTVPQNNIQGIKSTTGAWITTTQKNNEGLFYTATKDIESNTNDSAQDNARRITLEASSFVQFPSIALYPYVVLKGEIKKENGITANSDDAILDVNYILKLKNGTTQKFYAKTNPTFSDNGEYEIVLDLTKFNSPGNATYTTDDVDIHSSIQSILLKPWKNNSKMAEGDTFSINSITFCNSLEKTTKGGLFGEVMIEFPKMGYKFESINNTQKISVTRKANYSDFCYDAFKRGDKYNDYIYISVYDATRTNSEDRVHSLDRVNSNENYASSTAANTQSVIDLRNWTGLFNDWSILTFQAYTLLGCLNLLYSKSINFTNSLNAFPKIKFYETQRFYSLEGCKIITDSSAENHQIYQAFKNFSEDSSWSLTQIISNADFPAEQSNIPNKIMATNILGLFPKEWGASTSTYYCAPTINSYWWNGLLVIPRLGTSPKLGLVGRTGPGAHKISSETNYKMYCHIMYSQA